MSVVRGVAVVPISPSAVRFIEKARRISFELPLARIAPPTALAIIAVLKFAVAAGIFAPVSTVPRVTPPAVSFK